MNIMVTGGLGVNGSWVVRELVARGHEPVVVDTGDDTSLVAGLEGRYRLKRSDITDLTAMRDLIDRHEIGVVVHLAAYIAPDMDRHPHRAFEVNTNGTVTLLEAAAQGGVPRFVYASSRAVYGETPAGVGAPGYLPVGEDHPKTPRGAYGATKLASDLMGQVYRNTFGMEFAALRFAGIYGPGKQARHGKLALRSRLVEEPFKGNPVVVPKGGDQVDDMIYVADVAEAIVMATLAKRLDHGAYNIGAGEGVTLKQFAAAVRKVLPAARIEVGDGMNYLDTTLHNYAVFDIARAERDFGWTPRFGLEAGIADYVRILGERKELTA